MKLFTNGCSFTWGAEILENELKLPFMHPMFEQIQKEHDDFRQSNIWPYHLKNLLKADELNNLAIPASSNQRIVRTTLDFFISLIDSSIPINDYTAVIQWTVPSRYESYDDELKQYLLVTHSSISPKIKDRKKEEKLKHRFSFHHKNFNDEFYVDVVTLANFFAIHKVKYLFCTMSECHIPSGYLHQLNWLGSTPNTNQLMSSENMYKQKHPNLKGHKIIAEKIHQRLLTI